MVAQIANLTPAALDVIDWDGAVVEALDSSGFPMHLIRTQEAITGIRQTRAQQQAQQQQIEALGPISKALRAGNTKPEAGSPAQQMLNPEQSEAV